MSDKYQAGKSPKSDTTYKPSSAEARDFVRFSGCSDLIDKLIPGKPHRNKTYDLPLFPSLFSFSSPEKMKRETGAILKASAGDFSPIDQKREKQVVMQMPMIDKPEEYQNLLVTVKPDELAICFSSQVKERIKAHPLPKTKPVLVLPTKLQVILKSQEAEVETHREKSYTQDFIILHPANTLESGTAEIIEILKPEKIVEELKMPWVYSIETILAIGKLHASQQCTVAIYKAVNRNVQEFRLKVAKGKGKKNNQIWEEVAPSSIRRADTYEKQTMLKEKAKQYTERRLAEGGEDERLKRKVKITLNKLAPTNFDKLKVEIVEMIENGWDIVKELAKMIFDKAWSELMYTSMYAELCNFINQEYGYYEFGPYSSQSKRNKNAFRRNLLTLSQNIFESKIDLTKGSKEQQAQHKKKILGNIRFIGELFKVKILSSKIILACIFELLQEDEDKLEGAIILLKTCGNKLEESIVIEQTERAMERLDFLKSRVSIRLWIMIRKLENLRRNRWAEESDVPKPVEEVRKKHRRGQQRA